MNTKYLTLLFILIITLLLHHQVSASNSFHPKQIPAMYVFGDSFVDSGNNIFLPGKSNAMFPPYGIDFGDDKPTGRCTNGKTVADYFAIHLGLPFVPPYLGLSENQRSKITTGINYASASSGILPVNNNNILTLDRQIELFNKTIKNNLPRMFDKKAKLDRHLSLSLFVVSTGINDMLSNSGTSSFDFREFSLGLLKEFFKRLLKMYSLGARKFLVNNIAPAGCFPSTAARSSPRGKCDEKFNEAISFYNSQLPAILLELQAQLPGFSFIHSDLYKFLMELRETGNKYGIVETWKPCCPYNIDGDLDCNPYDVVCPNRDTYLFFDSHPSQISNQIFAKRCFNDQTICRPSGFKLPSNSKLL